MDSELLSLLALGLYLLYRLFTGRGGQRPQPQSPRPPDAEPAAGNELEDALREIREALGMEAPEDRPAPAPAPAPPPAVPAPSPPPRRPAEFFPMERKTQETVQETLPAPPAGWDAAASRAGLDTLPAAAPTTAARRPGILGRLRTPAAARDAFVLSEILGPPRSRRQGR